MVEVFLEYINCSNLFQNFEKHLFVDATRSISIDYNKKFARISLSILSADELLAMNEKFLDHHDYTDVITYNSSYDDALVGEIFISADRAVENASTFECLPETELLRYYIHGLLHLCGYDDDTVDKRLIMHDLENKYLKCST